MFHPYRKFQFFWLKKCPTLYMNNMDSCNWKEKRRWQGFWFIRCKHKENQVFSASILWTNKQMFCINSISLSNNIRLEYSTVRGLCWKIQHGMTESGRLTLGNGIICFASFWVSEGVLPAADGMCFFEFSLHIGFWKVRGVLWGGIAKVCDKQKQVKWWEAVHSSCDRSFRITFLLLFDHH